jgi:hypothetical protein
MKFGYLHDARKKHSLFVSVGEKNSSSPKIIEAVPCRLTERVQMEAVITGAVSQRLRLNLG